MIQCLLFCRRNDRHIQARDGIIQIVVDIKAYEIEETESIRYVGEFEYKDAQYQIMGVVAKEEFEKIIKNLFIL